MLRTAQDKVPKDSNGAGGTKTQPEVLIQKKNNVLLRWNKRLGHPSMNVVRH